MTTTCLLESVVGRHAACPGEACPFWRSGGGCAFDAAGPELAGRADVAGVLLGVRDRLAAERDAFDSRRLAAFAHELNKTARHELA